MTEHRRPSEPLVRAMKQLDQALQEQQLSPEADARILAAMQAAREDSDAAAPRTFWSMGWAVAVAAVALLFGGVSLLSEVTTPKGTHMGGLLVVRGAVIFVPGATTQSADTLQCESPGCRLRFVSRRTRIQLQRKARILRVEQQLKMLQGVASFDVSRRKAGELPLRITVSHGVVEVIGTGFTIYQNKRGGRLELHHGRVRFLHRDGHRQEIRPGQSVRWPRRIGRRAKRRALRRVRGQRVAPPASPMRVASLRPSRRLPSARRGSSAVPRRAHRGRAGRRQVASKTGALQRPRAVGGVVSPGQDPATRGLPPTPRIVPPRATTRAPRATGATPAIRPASPAPSRRSGTDRAARPLARDGASAPSGPSGEPTSRGLGPRPTARAVAPRRSKPRRRKVVLPALAGWIRELEQLRSQGRYALAAQKLRGHLQTLRSFSTTYQAARERLHYELGILLTHQLARPRLACKHWREHQRLFSQSPRYTREVNGYLAQLKCR